jgi:uncharacterized membrane protein
VLRRLFGIFFVFAGALHFARPKWYVAIMPDYMPAHEELVYVSGAAEIAGGVGTLIPATRKAGSWWSIATLLAVFPANVHMALNADRYKRVPGGPAGLYARLPVQALFILWAWSAGRD